MLLMLMNSTKTWRFLWENLTTVEKEKCGIGKASKIHEFNHFRLWEESHIKTPNFILQKLDSLLEIDLSIDKIQDIHIHIHEADLI